MASNGNHNGTPRDEGRGMPLKRCQGHINIHHPEEEDPVPNMGEEVPDGLVPYAPPQNSPPQNPPLQNVPPQNAPPQNPIEPQHAQPQCSSSQDPPQDVGNDVRQSHSSPPPLGAVVSSTTNEEHDDDLTVSDMSEAGSVSYLSEATDDSEDTNSANSEDDDSVMSEDDDSDESEEAQDVLQNNWNHSNSNQ
ncbi:WASH complex subunit 3-like [Macrosteles quadrilineatus]|uniref:WASH complex subunit 3-like n=1 Tax=Macrosteles quadrilineatus TaxID=74068 RepID=UPI0023E2DD28|nr:WASH complex subunit 3-like [Macrosteles quadrilineatus]